MSDVNVMVVSGRLVANPEMKFTPKGTAVTSMRLASNRYWRDKNSPGGDLKESALFLTVQTYGKMAEVIASHKKKGDKVLVRGRLDLSQWTDKEGKPRQMFRLVSDEVNYLMNGKNNTPEGGGPPRAAASGATAASTSDNVAVAAELPDEDEEEIPF